MKKWFITALLILSLILSIPGGAACQDPGGLNNFYFHGDVFGADIVPVYIINMTPYTLNQNQLPWELGMITNWYMPKTIGPKSMAIGFFTYAKIATAVKRTEPISFDNSYTYTIEDGKGDPQFVVHLQNVTAFKNPADKSCWDKIHQDVGLAFTALGMIPEVGIIFKIMNLQWKLAFATVGMIETSATDWYMLTYPIARGRGCSPSIAWYCDYCHNPKLNATCTDEEKNYPCPGALKGLDAARLHMDANNCYDPVNRVPDPSCNYIIQAGGNGGHTHPFYSNNDKQLVREMGSYGPSYSIYVWRQPDYDAVDAFQELGPPKPPQKGEDPKLQKLYGFIRQSNVQKLSSVMEGLGPAKSSQIAAFIKEAKDIPPGPLSPEMDKKLDDILAMLKIQ